MFCYNVLMTINPHNRNVLVGIVMGSQSDWATMVKTTEILDQLEIGWEAIICSAHRTPQRAHDFGTGAAEKGIKVIVAAAGMSAHLAGVMASLTHLPVLGVPMDGKLMGGLDALLSTCNMPKGIPVGTMSMGSHGAVNAALFAASIIGTGDEAVQKRLIAYREKQTAEIPADPA